MFEAKLGNAGLLKKIMESIKDIVTDAPFDCTDTCMCLQAMDSSHVALVSLKLNAGIFETYRCDRTVSVGMSLANMAKALKCANNDDTCLIRCEETTADVVTFIFDDPKRGKNQEVTVRMMDIDNEHLGIPEQEFMAIVDLPSAEFQKTCRDLSMFSDSVIITVTKAGIAFTGKGDMGSSIVNYAPSKTIDEDEETGGVSLTVNDPVSVNFSVKYLNQFARAGNLSEKVRLCLCNDVPIVVEYPMESNSYLRFYLAPKIDDEATAAGGDHDMKD